ncbi:MAG TPA: hypothetical protein PK129_17590, partial [Cellvibrionaceae bacterium]|nr:hypothetical protein [Cellvibrionaceae bacterium]
YGEPRTQEFSGIAVQVAFKCPDGSVTLTSGPADDLTLKCAYQRSYAAVKLQEIEPLGCSSQPQTTGNPILLSSGAKYQFEQIEFEGVGFSYQFNSASDKQDPWQLGPDILKKGNDLQVEDKSKFYPTRPEACINGLAEFKSHSPPNGWIQNVAAEYDGCQCLLKKGGQVVSALGIQSDTNFGAYTPSLDLMQHKHSSGAITNYYRDCAAGQYKPISPNANGVLQISESGVFKLSSGGGVKVFDAIGHLTGAYTSAGRLINEYLYDNNGNLSSVLTENGRINYHFLSGKLSSIEFSSGKVLKFNYAGNLVTKVTHPDETTRIYHYEDTRFPSALTGITDERGVRFATWKYDEKGRAISSEHAGGAEKTTLEFNADGSTTVTNALGKKTTFSFTD